jgi:hypothetical protein
MAMTLTKYLNQKDPVRMPDVLLQEGEYIKGTTIQIPGSYSLTQVFIKGIDHEYVLRSDRAHLYTTDSDGNPKSVSCFRIV